MNTIIFDIDGTLVDSDAWDADLYVQSIREVLGDVHIHDDWNAYAQVTDGGILQQVFEEHDIPADEERVKKVEELFCEKTMRRIREQPCQPIPGAKEALHNLVNSNNWQVGFATGGWELTAAAKLESAGFAIRGLPLCSSSDYTRRTDIMKACRSKMPHPAGPTVYVGDGLWDQQASRELDWGFVAVGQTLQGCHDIWIADFLDSAWDAAPGNALQAVQGW